MRALHKLNMKFDVFKRIKAENVFVILTLSFFCIWIISIIVKNPIRNKIFADGPESVCYLYEITNSKSIKSGH